MWPVGIAIKLMSLTKCIVDFGREVSRSNCGALRPGMICFDRERNGDGQFAPETEGTGLDPVSATKVYGAPAARAKPGINGRNVAAGLGAAAAAALLTRRLRTRPAFNTQNSVNV